MTTPLVDIPGTTVWPVKQYLLQLISTNATPDGQFPLWVGFDEPGTSITPDLISVGRCRKTSKPTALVGSGGPLWMSEEYEIEVLCSSARGGDERVQPVVVGRAWDLASLVERLVRTDPSLGGLVTVAYPATADDISEPSESHKGRSVTVRLGIKVFVTQA